MIKFILWRTINHVMKSVRFRPDLDTHNFYSTEELHCRGELDNEHAFPDTYTYHTGT